jgi:hypothetical protein
MSLKIELQNYSLLGSSPNETVSKIRPSGNERLFCLRSVKQMTAKEAIIFNLIAAEIMPTFSENIGFRNI